MLIGKKIKQTITICPFLSTFCIITNICSGIKVTSLVCMLCKLFCLRFITVITAMENPNIYLKQ